MCISGNTCPIFTSPFYNFRFIYPFRMVLNITAFPHILGDDPEYSYLCVHATALKCFLLSWILQNCKIKRRYLDLILLTVSICAIPNVPYCLVLNHVINSGAIFSVSYVNCLLILREDTSFIAYGIPAFLGCLVSSEIECALNVFLLVITFYHMTTFNTTRDYVHCVLLASGRCIMFLFIWWFYCLVYIYIYLMLSFCFKFCIRLS